MAESDHADATSNGEAEDCEETEKGKRAKFFKCPECSSSYKRADHLRRHFNVRHKLTKEDLILCPVEGCLTEMYRKDHMQRHISQVHKLVPSEVLPFPTPTIPRRKHAFSKPGRSVAEHGKLFHCMYEDCEVKVTRREHLRRHIKNVHRKDPLDVMGAEAYGSVKKGKKKKKKKKKERRKRGN